MEPASKKTTSLTENGLSYNGGGLWKKKTQEGKIGTNKSTKTESLSKLNNSAKCGHSTLESKNAKTPTCTENGKNADNYCADCDTLIEAGAMIKAIR